MVFFSIGVSELLITSSEVGANTYIGGTLTGTVHYF